MAAQAWRGPVGCAAVLGLGAAAYQSGLPRKVLYIVAPFVDEHGAEIFWVLFSSILFVCLFPLALLRRLKVIAYANTLVLAAGGIALVAGALTTAWVLTVGNSKSSPLTPAGVAAGVQAGVLVAGVIAAAVGFWFNDQRRRREDETLRNDGSRLDQDKKRVEEERFIRTVELIGHENAGVRIGALHSLSGLARDNWNRRSTVVEVICAYLRQPFDYRTATSPDPAPGEARARRTTSDATELAQREYQVRQVAQKLLFDLLPDHNERLTGSPEHVVHGVDLDLRGAELDALHVSGKIFNVDATGARINGVVRIAGCRVPQQVRLDGAEVRGDVVILDSEVFDISVSKAKPCDIHLNSVVIDGLLDLQFEAVSQTRSGVSVRVQDCAIEAVLLPHLIDDISLGGSDFGAGDFLRGRIVDKLELRGCTFAGPLNLGYLMLPIGQTYISLPETDLSGFVAPRGWVLDAVDVSDPRLVRSYVQVLGTT